jgi:flagella basal body P-ring formation protein FlgA
MRRRFTMTFMASGIAILLTARVLAAQVAARDIARGTVLSTDDITVTDTLRSSVVPGWIARRLIRAGEPLRAPAVAPPSLVKSGESVRFRVRRGDVSLLFRGTALSSGALGDTIVVRLDVRRRYRGVVTGPGFVTALSDSL